jgi:hypothetical protein
MMDTKIDNIKQIIVNKLSNILGKYYDDFVNIMIETNSTIYGSFIIHCIHGDQFINNDIDISVKNNNAYEKLTNFMSSIMNFTNGNYNNYNRVSLYGLATINNTKFEIVLLEDDIIYKYDLDICNNSIVYLKNNLGEVDLNIHCVYDQIKNYNAVLLNFVYSNKLLYRLSKYIHRGFIIDYPLPVHIYVEYILYKQHTISYETNIMLNLKFFSKKIYDKLTNIFPTTFKKYVKINNTIEKLDYDMKKYYRDLTFYKCNRQCPIYVFTNEYDHYHYYKNSVHHIAVNDTMNILSKINYMFLVDNLNDEHIAFKDFVLKFIPC